MEVMRTRTQRYPPHVRVSFSSLGENIDMMLGVWRPDDLKLVGEVIVSLLRVELEETASGQDLQFIKL